MNLWTQIGSTKFKDLLLVTFLFKISTYSSGFTKKMTSNLESIGIANTPDLYLTLWVMIRCVCVFVCVCKIIGVGR